MTKQKKQNQKTLQSGTFLVLGKLVKDRKLPWCICSDTEVEKQCEGKNTQVVDVHTEKQEVGETTKPW